MKVNETTIVDNVSDIFSDFVPKLCETLDIVDDDNKFAMIGATTEMLLEVLVNQMIYDDYMAETTGETEKKKIEIAISLINGCIKKLTEANA